ncbi:MAG TPA: metallophosphoesterase [Bryobacteraceae bacterium]|nr:metallophosphoesterase [Bryobacteraceae bacterium]
MRIPILFPLLALLSAASVFAREPWFFAIMSDPQFGMYAKDQNFIQETANFEFAIANANRLRPKFLVVTGDLVNLRGDSRQIAEYKRLLQKVDPGIPVYSVPGNHDLGNVPTPAAIAAYRKVIGPDYYTFKAEDILGIVLDSSLIRSPEDDPQDAKKQEEWLVKILGQAKLDPQRQIVVFQHIPYFLKSANEKDEYFNIPQPARRKYLDLLEAAGVRYVYAGHYHRNAIGRDGPLTETVSGAVGMPLGGSLSGFRVVAAHGDTLDSTWFCFGGIPNRVDLQKPLSTPCPQ